MVSACAAQPRSIGLDASVQRQLYLRHGGGGGAAPQLLGCFNEHRLEVRIVAALTRATTINLARTRLATRQ